jgi:hypothetical protein
MHRMHFPVLIVRFNKPAIATSSGGIAGNREAARVRTLGKNSGNCRNQFRFRFRFRRNTPAAPAGQQRDVPVGSQ